MAYLNPLSRTFHGIFSSKPLMASEADYTVELGAVLQNHISGDLTPHFQYDVTFDPGLHLQTAHHAIAKFRGVVIGKGKRFSRSAAKNDAAKAALEYIREHGPPDPFKCDRSNAVLDLQDYLLNRRGGSLVAWFSWFVSHTGPDHRRTYRATARFDGGDVGYGEGYSIDGAKRMAATEALQWFHDNPQPPSLQPPKGTPKRVPDHAIDWDYIFKMMESG